MNRTTAHLGKIYVSPDSSRYLGPYETLVITNVGDELLESTYNPSGLLLIPAGESKTLYLTPRRPELGSQQWVIRLENNDPDTPLLEIPASYEGIVQPPLVVEDLNGDTVVSGETVFQLDPAIWDPNRSSPTAVPRVVTRTVRQQFDIALQGDGFRLVLGDPQGADYGRIPVGTLETRTFTLENKGAKRITGISADLTSGAGGQLTLVGDIPWGLDPGESCEFTVEFAPTQVGPRFSFLKVTTLENLGNPLLVAISATGTAAPSLVLSSERGHASAPGVTTMEVPYDSVDIGDYKRFAFDVTEIGGSEELTFVMVNNGAQPVQGISAMLTTGATVRKTPVHREFTLASPIPRTLAPKQRMSFKVRFNPRSAGSRTLQL